MITDTASAITAVNSGGTDGKTVILGVVAGGIGAGALIKGAPFAWKYVWKFFR